MRYLSTSAGKFIYLLFIGWVGFLAPSVYFDLFAIDHYVPPYRLALFQPPLRSRQMTAPEPVATRLARQVKLRLVRYQDLIQARSLLSGPAHLLGWSLGHLYLSAGIISLLLLQAGRFSLTVPPAGASADLPPPKKPPRRWLAPA